MVATVISGNGVVLSDTRIQSIDSSTQITLDKLPSTGGTTTLSFSGVEYTDGVQRGVDYVDIAITATTPTLYITSVRLVTVMKTRVVKMVQKHQSLSIQITLKYLVADFY